MFLFLDDYCNSFPWGNEVIESVPSLNIKVCTGCFGCNNGELQCVMKDDLIGLKEKLATSDAIVLVAPCFIFSAPSSMKNIMDRLAAWALHEIETGGKRRLGISISMAGASGEWHSIQRELPGLFLKLMNCDIVFIKTYENMGLKGEILLSPQALREIEMAAESAKTLLLGQKAVFPSGSEDSRLAYCPNCGNDSFRIYGRKTFVCSVCGLAQKATVRGLRPAGGVDKLSPEGAKEHSAMIGGKIESGFAAGDEIARRLDAYLAGNMDRTEYHMKPGEGISAKVEWEPEGLDELSRAVPKAFQPFVKKAVEKKAAERGAGIITKELFLEIKKASGN